MRSSRSRWALATESLSPRFGAGNGVVGRQQMAPGGSRLRIRPHASCRTSCAHWRSLSGDPRSKVVADVFHMIRGGGSVDDLLLLDGDRMSCFHINDVPSSPNPLTQTDADHPDL